MDRVYSQSDVAIAIARSRAARDARKRRRRRNVLLACASILLGGGTAMSIFGFSPSDAVEAATKQAKTLAELIDQRSPGERTSAELTKLKKAHHAAAKARRAPKVAVAPPLPPTAVALANLLLPPEAVLAPVTLLDAGPPPTLGGIVIPPPGGGTTPGVNLMPPPGGTTPPPGDDGHVTIPKDEPKDTIPVTPVPEPGTWATMLLGFALIGWRLRRQTMRAASLLPA